jgi:hypothetical protein
MASGLLLEAQEELQERRRRGLNRREMFENAIHEAGHGVTAVCLGIGPLPTGIKLWRHGRQDRRTKNFCWGVTRMCRWTKADGYVRQEIENSVVSVLAGRLPQYRITEVFEQEGWSGQPALYEMSLELIGVSAQDDALVGELLGNLPLKSGETLSSVRVSLEDRTQRLLDHNWPAVLAVANAVLKAKHCLLAGRTITKIVNRRMKAGYSPIKSCRCIGL